ncbi:nuclear transport factor 2 family protein [Pseudomonas aeruginosa]|uniref:nuclear transport factor 2 family protein n=1 Tax=Pseudomonas aeruginosa TaxID=287 RepID=UPI0005C444C7|nr:nuclear transport factor 2 family protein [Pseudomonas aeruginosa]MED5057562.1 nuclear transport factor 2 family protein [Pseudomonas aeruginosa]
MTTTPRAVIEEFFRRTGSGEPVERMAELVSEQVDWFVAGDTGVVPWIGRKVGKAGAAEFYAQIRAQIASEEFEVRDILSQGNRVVALGVLASRVLRTGKLIESEFCFDFTVDNGEITRFRLFEDSFAVAQAAS